MTPRIPPQGTVVDADHRGGWIQILGGKASEPETSRLVEKTQFLTTLSYRSKFKVTGVKRGSVTAEMADRGLKADLN